MNPGAPTHLDLSERLHVARRRKGYSLRDLAEHVDFSYGTLGNWEKGKGEPTISAIAQLAEALDVSPAWLAGFGQEEMPVVASWADQLMFELGGSYLRAA